LRYHPLKSGQLLKQPFSEKTLLIQSPGRLILDKGSYTDNIILHSPDTIEVWPSVKLRNVILIGKAIVLKQGFAGKLQAFAASSVVVEKGCQLNYPSFIGCIGSQPDVNILIEENSRINGGVICFSQKPEEGKTSIYINKGAVVYGKVYVNGDISFAGSINGSLYCDRFIYRTRRSFYENFMYDCTIDEEKLPAEYASFCITDDVFKLKEVKLCQ
jgi:hypothetical protein